MQRVPEILLQSCRFFALNQISTLRWFKCYINNFCKTLIRNDSLDYSRCKSLHLNTKFSTRKFHWQKRKPKVVLQKVSLNHSSHEMCRNSIQRHFFVKHSTLSYCSTALWHQVSQKLYFLVLIL